MVGYIVAAPAALSVDAISFCLPVIRRFIVSIVVMACVPVLCGFTVKGVNVEKSYYRISGKSHGELKKTVRRNAPRAGRAYGLGIIDFFPRYQTRRIDGNCRITQAEVGLRIKLRLPQWQGDSATPRKVARIAKRFERVIDAHEMQHVKIARRYARLMKRELLKLPVEKSCWALRGNARSRIKDVKIRHIWAHRRFDNRTRKQIRRLL